ncbi:MAG: Bug family tripartite tricarboxylate transporter substrate binding protein [Burkholderiales bacterium]
MRNGCQFFLLGFAFCVALAQPTLAQSPWPSKPIRFIVPNTPGGMMDTFARSLSQHLQERLGQPVFVENRPGASQAIGLDLAAKAAPDGHTLVYGTQSNLVFLTASRKSLPYDPIKDFAHVGTMFASSFYLTVNANLPAKSVQELVSYAKANPGKLSFGSIGVGSAQHLSMELFRARTGVDIVHIPYKGAAASMAGLLANQVEVMFEGPGSVPHMRSGKLRGLGTTGLKRSSALPDLPPISEAGVPGYEMSTWLGVSTQAAVPRAIVDRLHAEIGVWLALPQLAERFASQNLDLTPSTPEQMTERVRNEIPLWTKIMRAAGMEPE